MVKRLSVADRAQSEVVGSLLLVGVGVILIGVIAVLGLGLVDGQTQDPTTVSVQSEITDERLTITHVAGDSISVEETVVILRGEGIDDRISIGSTVPLTSDGDGDFETGEEFELSHAAQGEVQVMVVHEPSEAVLYDRTYTLAGDTVTRLARFDQSPPSDWSGNVNSGGSVEVKNGGRSVNITGNRWQAVDFEYTVTSDTVITFEFRSGDTGEIHGIGFESDTSQESGRVVRVAGSQNWGVPVDSNDYGPYYTAGDGWVRYEIPIGEIYDDNGKTGPADRLLFVNDCDGCSAESAFRNVRVYEADD